MTETRRDVLVAVGVGVLGYRAIRGGGGGGSSSGGGGVQRSRRRQTYRPLVGGIPISIPEADSYGTISLGYETTDGDPAAVTNRHVVDPGYPDSSESDVLGTTVNQPFGGEEIGHVTEVGESKGTNATDWAVILLNESVPWSAETLGVGSPESAASVSKGDRLVMSGVKTGIQNCYCTSTGVSANWKGSLLSDVIEYRVGGDPDTSGNSGGWVGKIDSDGRFYPAGIHTFASGDYNYAIPLSQINDSGGALRSSGGSDPTAPTGIGSYLEGAVGAVDRSASPSTAGIHLCNVGDEPVAARTVEVRDASDGSVIDSVSVSVDPLETELLALEAPESEIELATGDETVTEYLP